MNLYYINSVSNIGDYAAPSLYIKQDAANETITVQKAFNVSDISPTGAPAPDMSIVTAHTSITNAQLYTFNATPGVSFTRASLLSKWSDDPEGFQVWGIGQQVSSPGLLNPRLVEPIPVLRLSSASKLPPFPSIFNRSIVFSFNIPFQDSVYSDCFIVVLAKDLVLDGDSFNVIPIQAPQNGPAALAYMPSVKLTSTGSVTATQAATITAQIVDYQGNPITNHEMDLVFENVNGQISHNRCTTVNGIASTKVWAPLMDVGETVRVKVGTKYYSGISDISLTVGS